MKRSFSKNGLLLLGLLLLALLLCGLYLTYHTYGNFQFAWLLRGKKIMAFLLVALATGTATVSFQTMTQNQFLTPNILGLDSLYVLIQTILFFILGGVNMLAQKQTAVFLISILMMAFLSLLLAKLLLKQQHDLFILLMLGMILGTLFSSTSNFLQVLMDPNEYDLLQGRLFASFSNINTLHLSWAAGIILLGSFFLFAANRYLDVLHLGSDQATNLGISLNRFQILLLFLISLLTGTATALVGPITFLGFIVANISYQLMPTYRHRYLFPTAILLGIIFLVGSQFLVEQVFQLKTTVSVVTQFIGGLYFIWKIIYERSRQK
ncbi:iron chelate uptake ABC transporter family permease subunit [Enterococcus dongliensis]|uniref:Iron chelate uptake ABC transporter family permease subunit n=1 Tax=Enterococcus dongliensis TaxID=2559925 RepID=A0AAP5KR12_9ENTE|nr:iron chelate uptake ABC transporter family permease subunit [Enterococcus dongliensis]MDT2596433.1 iron chelate uptake ABC transporter family permease subunit [Enterococcus dongliensis]MDT2603721.1 iron chelate uptake ABC transporter family permease subunit [Enterococcus dongliensis]MDT2612890.1 iron chelate uptake ABC transporter family permease subunit [Enterococcus dongliensis]MDT2634124.1 iron chelate uptake ABC transporter family permease subunit [Enterococcus dongliensis]MDT2637054.1 